MWFNGFFYEKNQVCKTWEIFRQIASICPVFVSFWCSCYSFTDGINFNRFLIRINSFCANWIWPIFAAAARPSPCISPWGPLYPVRWPILPRYRGSLSHLRSHYFSSCYTSVFCQTAGVFILKKVEVTINLAMQKSFCYELPLKSYDRKEKRWPT